MKLFAIAPIAASLVGVSALSIPDHMPGDMPGGPGEQPGNVTYPPWEERFGVVKRQDPITDIILAAIIGASSGALKGWLGPEQPACSWKDPYSDQNWWSRAFQENDDGKNITIAEICWQGGDYDVQQPDLDAAKCLVDLHAQQDFSCIDLDGSSCNNYPGTGVGNVRISYSLSGNANQQLDQFSADRAKATIDTLLHQDKGWDIGTNIVIMPMNDDGTYTSWTVQLRGTGDEDC